MTTDHAVALPLDPTEESVAALEARGAQTRLSVRENASWMFVGNVVYAACQWAMLMVLAKLGTAAMVGQFVLALAVATPVTMLFMLHLRAVQATDARREYQFGDYLALRLATTAMSLAVIVGLGCAYRRETMLVIAAMGASAAIESVSDVIYGLLQQHERMDRIAQSMMAKGFLALPALAAATLWTGRLVYGVLAIAAARTLVLVFFDLANARAILLGDSARRFAGHAGRRGVLPRWVPRTMLSLAGLSLPLGIVMMLGTLNSSIPRYFVESALGERSLGVFGAIAYLGVAGTTVIGAVGQAASPGLARYYAQGQIKEFCLHTLALMALGAAIGLAGVIVALVAGRQLLALVYGAEYAAHNGLLVWTMIAASIGYAASFGGFAITAARYFRVQVPLFALLSAATGLTCWWLIPLGGLKGAAISLCVTALAQLLGEGLILWHALRVCRSGGAMFSPAAQAIL